LRKLNDAVRFGFWRRSQRDFAPRSRGISPEEWSCSGHQMKMWDCLLQKFRMPAIRNAEADDNTSDSVLLRIPGFGIK
jgi:hypothetical protein